MATIYGVEATKREAGSLAEQGKLGGIVRSAYDEYLSAGAVIATGALKLMKLPQGARLIGIKAVWPDHGTTGAATLGWEANGVDAADADGIIAAMDLTAAGNVIALASAGFQKKFGAETQITCTIGTATDASTDLKIQVELFYVVD